MSSVRLGRMFASVVGAAGGPAGVDPHVAAVGPARLLQPLQECREASLRFGIIFGVGNQHADAPHALGLLRPRRKRHVTAAPPTSVMNWRRGSFDHLVSAGE